MKTSTTFFIACLAAIPFAGHAQDFDYSFKESYSISSPAKLTIASSDGNIDVQPGNGGGMEIFFIAKKNGQVLEITRAELEEELTLTIVKTGNSLDINVKYPVDYGTTNFMNRLSVDFRVFVPTETSCDLRASDGDISVGRLKASQRLKTSDGNIRFARIDGEMTAHTSDGDIKGREVRGAVNVRTSDGNIELSNITGGVQSVTSDGDISMDGVTGNVSSTTSDGNIEMVKISGDHYFKSSDGDITFSDLSGSVEAIVSDGNISGNIIELTKKLKARSSDGNINITIPDKLGMDLYVKGESLNVPLSDFSGRTEKHLIDGTSNGGGIEVNLTTSDGRITLTYR